LLTHFAGSERTDHEEFPEGSHYTNSPPNKSQLPGSVETNDEGEFSRQPLHPVTLILHDQDRSEVAPNFQQQNDDIASCQNYGSYSKPILVESPSCSVEEHLHSLVPLMLDIREHNNVSRLTVPIDFDQQIASAEGTHDYGIFSSFSSHTSQLPRSNSPL